jgi:hypothetical protein
MYTITGLTENSVFTNIADGTRFHVVCPEEEDIDWDDIGVASGSSMYSLFN